MKLLGLEGIRGRSIDTTPVYPRVERTVPTEITNDLYLTRQSPKHSDDLLNESVTPNISKVDPIVTTKVSLRN